MKNSTAKISTLSYLNNLSVQLKECIHKQNTAQPSTKTFYTEEDEAPSCTSSNAKSFTVHSHAHYLKHPKFAFPTKLNVFISEKQQRIRTSHPLFSYTTNRQAFCPPNRIPAEVQSKEIEEQVTAPFLGSSSYRSSFLKLENNRYPAYKEIRVEQMPIKFTGVTKYNEYFTKPNTNCKTTRLPQIQVPSHPASLQSITTSKSDYVNYKVHNAPMKFKVQKSDNGFSFPGQYLSENMRRLIDKSKGAAANPK